MIGILAIPLGLIACAAVLALTRVARLQSGDIAPDPAGDALAVILAWIALAGLAISALLMFGLLQSAGLIILPLVLARMVRPGPTVLAANRFTLPLAWAAVVLAIIALFGIVSLYSEVLTNG